MQVFLAVHLIKENKFLAPTALVSKQKNIYIYEVCPKSNETVGIKRFLLKNIEIY